MTQFNKYLKLVQEQSKSININEKLITSLDELVKDNMYKIESGLGGSFDLKYLGTIINNIDPNYGKHIFFQPPGFDGFGNKYYYYSDEEVLKKIHNINSSIYENESKIYSSLWYAIHDDFEWQQNEQVELNDLTWKEAVKIVKKIAHERQKEVRLSTSKGYNNQGYYFHYKDQILENNDNNNIVKLVDDFAKILQDKVNDYYNVNHPTFKEKNTIPQVKVLPGKTYIKINIGDSGKFMADINDGLLYFIKTYGVIDRKKVFGSVKNLIDSDFVYDGYSINKPGIPRHPYGYAGRITENKLRSVTVKYENGDEVNTSMAAHLTDDEIRDYYKIGKTFNVGLGPEDNLTKVKEVIINESTNENLEGGLADNLTIHDIALKHSISLKNIEKELEKGIIIEMEHTNDKLIAKEIALDHLYEMPDYYSKLLLIESSNNHVINKFHTNINTIEDVKKFINMLYIEFNLNLHPDDPFQDYIDKDGKEIFTNEEATKLNKIMDDAFDVCEKNNVDIYEISLEIHNNIYGDISEAIGKADIINILTKYTTWLNEKQLLVSNDINTLVHNFMGISESLIMNETYNVMSITIPDESEWINIIEPLSGKEIRSIEVLDNVWAIRDKDIELLKNNIGKSIKFRYLKDENIKYMEFVELLKESITDEEEEEDLFSNYESLPQNVQDIINKFGELDENSYENCDKFIKELETFGYTCDYGLDAQPYGLKKIKNIKESKSDYPYELHFSDGITQKQMFKDLNKALSFAKELIKKPKMKNVELFKNKPGFHSTTQEEYLIYWWGNGSYWDNVSKREPKLLDKKLNNIMF